MYLLAMKCWASLSRDGGVGSDAAFYGVSAQASSGAGGKQRIAWGASAFGQPDMQ